MTLNPTVKVPLPEKGVIVPKKGSPRRVYKVLRTYRNGKGQPTNDRRVIGKIDEESGMLIPNAAYYEYYGDGGGGDPAGAGGGAAARTGELPAGKAVVSPLASFLALRVLSDLGARGMLADAFGEADGREAALAAAYMLCRGNVMQGAADWCEGFVLGEARLTSQSASALFARLGREGRAAFLRAWASSLQQREYLAYDVTSVSTYSAGVSDAEWGHNRDGERLPQVNLAMYLGEESRMPAFYCTYPGSIVDKSHLPYMMADNAGLGIDAERISFVMDRGFCTTANVAFMRASGHRFVMGAEVRHKCVREAVDAALPGIVRSGNRLPGGIHGEAVPGRYYGERLVLHVFWDEEAARRRRADLYRRVDADAEELSQMADLRERDRRRLSRYHVLSEGADGALSFEEDHAAVDAAAARCGAFCLLTNDRSLTCAEALRIYRDKDAVEKGFDDLKNHLDMSRLRTHGDATTDGKVLCAFVSLIAAMRLRTALAPVMRERHLTLNRAIAELEKAKVVDAGGGMRLMNPLTRVQKDILGALGVTEDDYKAYVAGGGE